MIRIMTYTLLKANYGVVNDNVCAEVMLYLGKEDIYIYINI